MASRLTEKVAIITGASAGIGAATAKLFAQLGAKLSLIGRNEVNLKKVSEICASQPGASEPFLIVGDITNDDDRRRIVDSTVEKYGRIDILVNNAGMYAEGSIENTSLELFDTIMNTNCRSAVHLTMIAVPHLIKAKGNILNVSSVNGSRASPNKLAHCMSKSALNMFTSCTALELAGKGVRVNSVNPGFTLGTDILQRGPRPTVLKDEDFKKYVEIAEKAIPLGRAGEVDEVAQTIAFLVSDAASNITGEHIHVDGGVHIACPQSF